MEVSDLEHGIFDVALKIGSYVKVGSPLDEHPYVHRPEVHWQFTGKELLEHGGRPQGSPLQLNGADLFVAAERISQQPLPLDVWGSFLLEPRKGQFGFVPLYLMGRQKDDAKAWTSPLFITFS
jgi:hypothetical protein